jgi:hypothetical protein
MKSSNFSNITLILIKIMVYLTCGSSLQKGEPGGRIEAHRFDAIWRQRSKSDEKQVKSIFLKHGEKYEINFNNSSPVREKDLSTVHSETFAYIVEHSNS